MPTVLILDDEPFVRHAARRFLKGSGYGCVESKTVERAIELLHTTPVIAAMLDMRLPCGRTGSTCWPIFARFLSSVKFQC